MSRQTPGRNDTVRGGWCFALCVCILFLAASAETVPVGARETAGCFVAGTPVTLATGRRVAIEKIAVGDRVRAFTPEGRLVHALVRQVFRFERRTVFRMTTENGLAIEGTGEHPIGLGAGKFRNLADLFPGIPIITVDPLTGTDKVREVRRRNDLATVYNLEVDEPRTFIAGGILVHNKGNNKKSPVR